MLKKSENIYTYGPNI